MIKLKSLIKENIDSIITKWITNPNSLNDKEYDELEIIVKNSKLQNIKWIERVSSIFPDWYEGQSINLPLISFSIKRFSKNEKTGHIGWKTSDKSIISIYNPKRGLKIDYSNIKILFVAENEKEIIITGKYIVYKILQITEPGIYSQYNYKIPYYILKEI